MLRKHSVSIQGHQTSFSLEDEFWTELKSIAKQRGLPMAKLISGIDESRTPQQNLSSALRVFVLNHALGTADKQSEA